MTASELLAMLGRAWPRLLIYPGGLTAFVVVWLMGRGWVGRPSPPAPLPLRRERGADDATALPLRRERGAGFPPVGPEQERGVALPPLLPQRERGSRRCGGGEGHLGLAISAVVLPWLGLALLPLPHVAAIPRQTDVIVVLALLEWPLVLTIAREFRALEPQAAAGALPRLAVALNSYPPLILATLVLALAAGSFEPGALARPPDETTPALAVLQHWLGAIAWTLALPPALGIGPFAACPAAQRALRCGLRLRAIGLVAIAALPWFPPFGEHSWLLPLPPLLIAALLWGFDRLTAGQPARRWARAYLAFDAALLLVLLWSAYASLQERLV